MGIWSRITGKNKAPRLAAIDMAPNNPLRALQAAMGPREWSVADELQKAAINREDAGKFAYNLDPHYLAANGASGDVSNYIDSSHRGTLGLTYGMLRAMSSVPVLSAIISTRVTQLGEFATPVNMADRGQIGYHVKLADPAARMTLEEHSDALRLQEWVRTCGDPMMKPFCSFEQFLLEVGRDSMTFDQGNFQVFRLRNKDIQGFRPVDASTIRRAMPTQQEIDDGVELDYGYIQVVDKNVVRVFTEDEMAWGVRRHRSDIQIRGYGFPELSELVRIAIKSKMDPGTWQSFMRQFHALIHGVQNANKTVLLQLDPDNQEEIQSVGLSKTNKDMEFKEWMAYLQKIACSIFQIDPAELGYVYGAEGQTGAMTQQGPEMRLKFSKEKGLRPFVRAVERWFNDYVMRPKTGGKYILEFVGLDRDLEEMRLKHDVELLKLHTLNQVRALRGLQPLDPRSNPTADMIGNPVQLAQNLAAMRLRQEEMERMEEMAMAMEQQAVQQAEGARQSQQAEQTDIEVLDTVTKALTLADALRKDIKDPIDKDPIDDEEEEEDDEDADKVADPYAHALKGGEIGLVDTLSRGIAESVARRAKTLSGS